MATRFYLRSSGAPAVSHAFDAAWEDVTGAARRTMATTKASTTAVTLNGGGAAGGAADALIAQFVSPPLAAQTISGTLKGQFKARRGDASIQACAQVVARVIGDDGTVRGTLFAAHSEATSSAFASAPTNRKFPLAGLSPATLVSVAAQDGDRIVVEIGGRVEDNGIDLVSILVHDDQGSDLPEDETSTATANPWLEFSADISEQGAAVSGGPAGGIGVGIGIGL